MAEDRLFCRASCGGTEGLEGVIACRCASFVCVAKSRHICLRPDATPSCHSLSVVSNFVAVFRRLFLDGLHTT
jgi:hypothetical protein